MIDEILGQAKERQLSGLKKGTLPLQSLDCNGDGKETNSKLAELANTSTATVQRMKKVKV
ncbi:hypothetical protein GU334_03955 [Lactococcus raffinolactis]|uniref:Uncharacterized protein n=1 Tax=Pseudolactococcus raffinolactis TaxID=1366 RepID=A0AAE6YLA4_9LACT|nr:hypothetical protein [Lactococcus raffinolactis]QIW58105.1 hypothetical protein GU334_03955 [Lactococcus raffinolactis]